MIHFLHSGSFAESMIYSKSKVLTTWKFINQSNFNVLDLFLMWFGLSLLSTKYITDFSVSCFVINVISRHCWTQCTCVCVCVCVCVVLCVFVCCLVCVCVCVCLHKKLSEAKMLFFYLTRSKKYTLTLIVSNMVMCEMFMIRAIW